MYGHSKHNQNLVAVLSLNFISAWLGFGVLLLDATALLICISECSLFQCFYCVITFLLVLGPLQIALSFPICTARMQFKGSRTFFSISILYVSSPLVFILSIHLQRSVCISWCNFAFFYCCCCFLLCALFMLPHVQDSCQRVFDWSERHLPLTFVELDTHDTWFSNA